jgi:hypothetical protein
MDRGRDAGACDVLDRVDRQADCRRGVSSERHHKDRLRTAPAAKKVLAGASNICWRYR